MLAPSNGEGSGNGDPVLCYGDGSPVSDNPEARKALRAHVATGKAIQVSIDVLRELAKALLRRAQKQPTPSRPAGAPPAHLFGHGSVWLPLSVPCSASIRLQPYVYEVL